jgi:RHS repeat-associated protein
MRARPRPDHARCRDGSTVSTARARPAAVRAGFHREGGVRLERARVMELQRTHVSDPKIGRFISETPSGSEVGDANFYAYVGNNPVNLVDPSGLQAAPGQVYVPGQGWKYDPAAEQSARNPPPEMAAQWMMVPITITGVGAAASCKQVGCGAKLAADLALCYYTFKGMPKSLGACIFAAQSNYRMCVLGVPWPI